jgi:sulfur relay (sulfurtransferase) complex TusBCD TusD component (DsrE family)
MCRWAEKKTFGVQNPTDELVRQLYQDLLNRNPDLGERASIEFFRDGVSIGKRGEGPQKIEFHLKEQTNTPLKDEDPPRAVEHSR